MNLVRNFIIGILSILIANNVLAAPLNHVTYSVRAGDTLGEVLDGLGICPLWGEKQSISQTLKLNPGLKSNPNFIRPSTKIKLPVETLPVSSDYQINEKNEVSFNNLKPEYKCRKNNLAKQLDIVKDREVAENSSSASTSEIPAEAFEETKSFSSLRAQTDIFYSSLDMTDTSTKETANLLSRINSAYQFAWDQQWDEKNKSFLYYRSEKQTYESVQDKYEGKSYNLQGFGLGYKRELSPRLSLTSSFRAHERLFARAISITTLKLDRAVIPELNFTPSYHLLSKGSFDLYTDVGFSYLMSSKTSDYTIKSGQRYSVGLSLVQKIKDLELLGRSYYSLENQDSSIMTKKTTELGISLGIGWSFGK